MSFYLSVYLSIFYPCINLTMNVCICILIYLYIYLPFYLLHFLSNYICIYLSKTLVIHQSNHSIFWTLLSKSIEENILNFITIYSLIVKYNNVIFIRMVLTTRATTPYPAKLDVEAEVYRRWWWQVSRYPAPARRHTAGLSQGSGLYRRTRWAQVPGQPLTTLHPRYQVKWCLLWMAIAQIMQRLDFNLERFRDFLSCNNLSFWLNRKKSNLDFRYIIKFRKSRSKLLMYSEKEAFLIL